MAVRRGGLPAGVTAAAGWRPRRAQLGWAVLLLHVGLVWLLIRAGHPAGPAAPLRITLRLLPPVERPAPASPTAALPNPTTRSTTVRATRPAVGAGQPPTLRARVEAVPPVESLAVSSATAAAAAAASQAERPLDLRLPRAFIDRPGTPNPVTDDPRAHAAWPTPEQRMTHTLGNRTDNSEEVLADGTRRIRRGGDCALVHPSRVAQLFPFNESAQRTPKTVDSCD